MKVLLIGGPRFVGYALIESLLAHNHTVTMFNRGKTNPELFIDQVDRITGNRDGEISNIGNRSFDVVIDTCGYVPRVVKQSVDYLKDKATYYVFISSISVYSDSPEPDRDETAKVIELEDKTTEDVMGQPYNYGGLKVLCERTVQEGFGKNAIIIRPGYIVGPHDPTNRFTYWPVRVRKGGKMIVPGDTVNKLQIVDVRDLAEFTVKLLEAKKTGVYNVAGPAKPFIFKDLAKHMKGLTKSTAELIYVTNDWLKTEKAEELPLWSSDPNDHAMMETNVERAIADGLQFRPVEETIKDTLKWYDEIQGDTKKWNAGLDAEKEQKFISKWLEIN